MERLVAEASCHTHCEGCGFRAAYDESSSETSQSEVQSRIIGGKDSMPAEWPWAVSLQRDGDHFCGGSILNPMWILTAAHCFQEVTLKELTVQVGATVIGTTHKDIHKVEKLIPHEDFSRYTADNDIGLLLLMSAIEITNLTTPICLPPIESFDIKQWRSCHVAGWGTRSEGSSHNSAILQKVKMVLIDWNLCMDWLWTLTENMICAGYEQGGRDACQGDSGGPLMCRQLQHKIWYQVGIVSWGKGCGRKKSPGVYTLVPNYLHWIRQATTEAEQPIIHNSLGMLPEVASERDSYDIEEPEVASDTSLVLPWHQHLWIVVMALINTRFTR
ncbi:serine protease 52-like [Ambystoma mexicanum]|uniref:serine protease 52-like n=1 Tax=Ambystoma mexicanum TaxID=8296 RepID=UPI0037E8106C